MHKSIPFLVCAVALFAAGTVWAGDTGIEGSAVGLAERPIWFNRCGSEAYNGWAFSANNTYDAYYKVNLTMPGTYNLCLDSYWRPVIEEGIPVTVGQFTQHNIYQTGYGYRGPSNDYRDGLRIGQTFLATSEHLFGIWSAVYNNAAGNTTINIRDTDQNGPILYQARQFATHRALVWHWSSLTETQLIPGHQYYIEYIADTGWLRAPCGPNSYADGMMYVEGMPQADKDLGGSIFEDNDGFLTEYWKPGGTYDSYCSQWGLRFTAHGKSLMAVYAKIGGSGDWNKDLIFTCHQFDPGPSGPAGPQVGMAKHGFNPLWGGNPPGVAAVWCRGEVPLTPGQEYYIKIRNTWDLPFDPWFVFVSEAERKSYKNGQPLVATTPQGQTGPADWAAWVYTEEPTEPSLGMSAPVVNPITATSAQISWTTTIPAMTQVDYVSATELKCNTPLDENLVTNHSVTLTGLHAGTSYSFTAKSYRLGYAYKKIPGTFVTRPGAVFTGQVRDEDTGAGIDGATVRADPTGRTTITIGGGLYTLNDLEPGTYTLTASYPGWRTTSTAPVTCADGEVKTVNIVLPRSNQRVTNAGFETGTTEGWSVYTDAFNAPIVKCGSYPTVPYGAPTVTAHSGSCFGAKYDQCNALNGGFYQQVTVLPGHLYSAACWAIAYWGGDPSGYSKSRIGIDPTGGTDYASANIVWGPWLDSSTPGVVPPPWRYTQTPFVSVSGTIITIFLDYANGAGYPQCRNHLNCFDDVAVIRRMGSLAEAKQMADHLWVAVPGVALTSSPGQLGSKVYVEAQDRAIGIRADYDTAPSVVVNDVATVQGMMDSTAAGERFLAQATFVKSGTAAVGPAYLNVNAVGGGCFMCTGVSGQEGPTGGIGLNTVGLLVRAAGRVDSVGAGYALINQGSSVQVKILTGNLGTTINPNDFVVIDGLCGLDLMGSDRIAVIQPRNSADLILKV